MKTIIFLALLLSLNLYAQKNWIPLQSEEKVPTPKTTPQIDINLSQIAPLNSMIRNATVLKQLLEIKNKKEKVATNEKKWFPLQSQQSK